MGKQLRTRRPRPQTSPDMTPMLDIVFIMLIFFIVTASFVRETGILPNVPEGKPQASKKNPTIGFQVDANNQLFHDGRLIDFWSVEGIIKQAHTEMPDAPVVIAMDHSAHTRHMVRLFDEAVSAGIARNKIAVLIRDK